MSIPYEPLLCPSLFRGIRRADLETLDASWVDFGQRVEAFHRKTDDIEITSPGALRTEVEQSKTKLMPQFLSAADIGVESGREKAWMMLTLVYRQDSDNVLGKVGVSCTLLSYLNSPDVRSLPIEFTGYAIDRLIQSAHMMDLPLSISDLNVVHVGFASAMIWNATAAKAPRVLDMPEHKVD